MEKITIKIKRYNPETKESKFEEFQIDTNPNMTVLDAVNQIKESKKPDISFRQSCNMGICGSCGAIVNGKNVLMCSTFCKNLENPIIIEPLKNFPIIKDLVVDTDNAMDKMRDAMPYTNFTTNKNQEVTTQTPKQLESIKQSSQCIKCMLCYSACPAYSIDNNFIGPAAAATAYKYNQDSRDKVKKDRLDSITNNDGIYKCTYVGECSNVCPKKVEPAIAIQKLKVISLLNSIKSFFKAQTARETKSERTTRPRAESRKTALPVLCLGKRAARNNGFAGASLENKQTLEADWWKNNKTYTLYKIREYSAILILIWTIFYIFTFTFVELKLISFSDIGTTSIPFLMKYHIIDIIGITGAVIHSLTWLPVAPMSIPLKINAGIRTILIVLLLLTPIIISFYLNQILWTTNI